MNRFLTFYLVFNYPIDSNSSSGAVTFYRVKLSTTNAQRKTIMKLFLKDVAMRVCCAGFLNVMLSIIIKMLL